MDLRSQDKVALVTGASSGIGAATATSLAEEGADVVVCYRRNLEGTSRTADAVALAGRRSWLCKMDVGDAQDVASAMSRLRAELDWLDILILCAGENIVTPLTELTASEWDYIIGVNLNGPFYVLKEALAMLGQGASVVTVASVAAHTGAPHHADYSAAKAGLINLTKSAARALAPNVRVNCVAPGITLTPMGQETASSLAPDYARTRLLAGRFATPDEIARCIVFLASPVADFITGATIDINGGRDLR